MFERTPLARHDGGACTCIGERAASRARRVLAALLLAAIGAGPLAAQQIRPRTDSVPATRDSSTGESSPGEKGSPRDAVDRFLTLTRAGHYADAAALLRVSDTLHVPRPDLARQLKAVLDRHLWVDLERLSSLATGDTTDGLAAGVDQIGSVRSADGVLVPIRLVRDTSRADAPWRFARGTVDRVPELYAALDHRWILDHLPDVLLRPGPLELLRWQWLALPILLAAATLIGGIASRVLRLLLTRLVARTRTEWDDAVLARVGAPLTAALTLATVSMLLPLLALYPPAHAASVRVVEIGFFVVFFWSLWRLVDVARQVMSRSRWAIESASSRALLPLGARMSKVIVLAMMAVAVLSLLGYPVASLVAGLGIGGLALALAAQKTVENLFGAFSIGIDQPFREGDFVKIEDFVGTVEAIGLRSSRFRTLDRTIITIPNGRLADMRLESFSARDRLRLSMVVGLVYDTTAAQMRTVLAGFERVLRAHPKIWPDAVVVRFREFAASSLDIEVMAWFLTSDWSVFQLIRQEVLLQFMDVVEAAGSSFAFPTQTVHIASSPSPNGHRLVGAAERGS